MNETTYNKMQTGKYLIGTFSIAWVMQIGAALLYHNGLAMICSLLMAVSMFAPFFGVLLSGRSLSGMGWKPHFRGKVKTLLMAWFLPAILTAIGAAVYFAAFPGHFDVSGEALVANGGAEALELMEAQGVSYFQYVLISAVGCLTYAPLFNSFLAVGEEAGWRGFLYPQLKARFGRKKGWLIGGVIWGSWHWPIIWLIGYEYGTDYVGFPIVGMLAFCITTIALGILCDWLYEKSGNIWIPSIFHGAFNAAATVPMALCLTDTGSMRLLGPAPNGIFAGIPIIVLAVILFLKKTEDLSCGKAEAEEEHHVKD